MRTQHVAFSAGMLRGDVLPRRVVLERRIANPVLVGNPGHHIGQIQGMRVRVSLPAPVLTERLAPGLVRRRRIATFSPRRKPRHCDRSETHASVSGSAQAHRVPFSMPRSAGQAPLQRSSACLLGRSPRSSLLAMPMSRFDGAARKPPATVQRTGLQRSVCA